MHLVAGVVWLVVVVGCSIPSPSNQLEPELIDTSDGRSLRFIELEVAEHADFDALAAQELTFRGPVTDDTGSRFITLFTTASHAASLEQHGFRPVGFADGATRSRVTWAYGPDCPAPPWPPSPSNCPSPAGAPYFQSYSEIVAEFEDMAGVATGAMTLIEIGNSHEGLPIIAAQFGPLEEHDPEYVPATIYLLSTYHAREWLSTAVSVQVARWLFELTTAGTINGVPNPGLGLAISHAAVVIVPVVNPDGYEYTRNTSRSWRTNRNLNDCSSGVDLNRNHSTAWNEMNYSCGETYKGPQAASEVETQVIENLLTGAVFPDSQRPVAVVSYHSYGDLLIYPDGYKASADSQGPRCGLTDGFNCFNADFTLLRNLFGDTHSTLFVDDVSYLPQSLEFKYYRDHSRTVLYPVSGDAGLHATYGPIPMLAVTPELPSTCYGFAIECDSRAEDVVLGAAADQINVIRRVLSVANTLDSTNPTTAYGPYAVGTKAPGLWTREYRDDAANSARATFVKSVFIPESTGTLTAQIGNEEYEYQRGRRGAQYELYSLPLAMHTELNG